MCEMQCFARPLLHAVPYAAALLSSLSCACVWAMQRLARAAGLPNSDLAASPCLRSRLQLGVLALPQTLAAVEILESEVRRCAKLLPL